MQTHPKTLGCPMMGARGSWHRHAPRLFVHPCRSLDGGSGGRQGYSARVKSTVPISVPLPAPANGTGVTARPHLGTCTRGLGGSENGLGQVRKRAGTGPPGGEALERGRGGTGTYPALDSAPNLCSSPLQLAHGARLDAACPALATGAGSSPLPASVSPLQDKAGSEELAGRKGS